MAGQTVTISVLADTKKFAQSFGDAGSIASSFGNGLATLGKTAGVALGAVTAAVTAGVGAVVKNGVQFDAAMQNYTASFTPLLGGADNAKAKLQELSSFAASTPFDLSGLAQASQTMLSFGETSADLLPDLKMLGDISQGNQDKLSGLALVFGQVQSTGHLMGQDLLQMINQGFNPLTIISQKTGESMDSLKDRMAAGQISFEEVKQAMVDATSAGGMFYGSMELGAKTLTGAWSSTQDGANILSGAIVSDLTPALTGVLNDGINPLLGGLVDLINGTDGAQAEVSSASAALIQQVQGLAPAIAGLAGSLNTVLTAVAPAAGQIVASLVDGIVTILPSLVSVASSIILTLLTAIAGSAPQLVKAAVPVLLNFASGLLSQLPVLIQTGFDVLVALLDGITSALPTLIPQVVQTILSAITTLFAPGNLTALLDAGLQLLMGLVQGILAALPQLIAALPAIILGLVTFIIGAIPQLIQAGITLLTALVGALPQIIDAIVKALPDIIVGIVTALISAVPQLIKAGVQLLIALITDLPKIIITIVNAMPQIITGIVGAFTDPKTIGQLAKAGLQLIQGLWGGISDAASWLWGKVSGFMGSLVDKIKGFFGIHSPSSLFRDEIGAQLGAGMALGILGARSLVADAAQKLSDAALVTLDNGSFDMALNAPTGYRASSAGGSITINVTGGLSTAPEIGRAVVDAIDSYQRTGGTVSFA